MTTQLRVLNPASEETLKILTCDTEKSIREKYQNAKKAQRPWSEQTLSSRIGILKQFWNLLDQKKDELARTLTLEVGKPLQQSFNEINGARTRVAFFLEQSEKFLATETVYQDNPSNPTRLEQIAYEPLGVIANISAWNYPYLVAMNVIIPGLIGGNAVLYKPSEFSPLTGLRITELLHEAGVPTDVFPCIIGDGTQGSFLCTLPLDGMFFTGSVHTGRKIHQAFAGKFVSCGFELGGKDPVYICEDADLAKVVPAVADGVFYNNGQSCCSVERIYVPAIIYKPFLDLFVKEVKSYKMGNPLESGVYLGPLTRNEQRKILSTQVEDAVKKGATLLTGGKSTFVNGRGYYFEPTVLANVNHEMSVMQEESFGPIIGIQSVSDDQEAIRLMNDTRYGLTAGVYTLDRDRAFRILSQVNAGSAYWNCCDRVSPHLPWSGRQDSGMGSTLSHLGIRAFVRPKAYHWIRPT